MAEEVNTGGMMKFRYDGAKVSGLKESEKLEIAEAYEKADARKRNEKRMKMLILLTILLVVTGIVGYWFLRR